MNLDYSQPFWSGFRVQETRSGIQEWEGELRRKGMVD
jgi:hypothetical protein